ncbi:MAG: alanine racemase [Eubacteriales bacterium]|nr:alanine racemase [Eubacteriales bacterium]
MEYGSTPSVQIDLNVVDQNIREAVETMAKYHITHRPHIKVHKSVWLANRQQELGCHGITCAKLGEAEVMADGGIDDILLAYPLIGRDKLERYRSLVERGIKVCTIINSLPGARGLSDLGEAMGRRLPVLIELDGGINRGGLKLGDPLIEFGKAIRSFKGIRVEGVEYYGGDIYGLKKSEDIRARAKKERDEIIDGAKELEKLGYDMKVLSGGSSFSIRFPEELEGLTEVRAGNYIFNDNALFSIGMVPVERCAMRVYSTVVARPDDCTAIIDAGTKTLTSDRVNFREGFGYIPEEPDAVIFKCNEEHGFVHCNRKLSWEVGDRISVIPNHACVVPNLCDEIYGFRSGRMERVISIEARGRNR